MSVWGVHVHVGIMLSILQGPGIGSTTQIIRRGVRSADCHPNPTEPVPDRGGGFSFTEQPSCPLAPSRAVGESGQESG